MNGTGYRRWCVPLAWVLITLTGAPWGLLPAHAEGEEFPLWSQPSYEKKLYLVGQRLLQANGIEERIAFRVIRDDQQVNAYAQQGFLKAHTVAVYRGLLRYLESDDELAALLGHEIAHITRRHGTRTSWISALGAGLGAGLLTVLTLDPTTGLPLPGAPGTGAALGQASTARFSQKSEREADRLGIDYMVKAGYHPLAAESLMNKITADMGPAGRFLSSHPQGTRRMAALRDHIETQYPQFLPPDIARNTPGAPYAFQPDVSGQQRPPWSRQAKALAAEAGADSAAAQPREPLALVASSPKSLPSVPNAVQTLPKHPEAVPPASQPSSSAPRTVVPPQRAQQNAPTVAQVLLTLRPQQQAFLKALLRYPYLNDERMSAEFPDLDQDAEAALTRELEQLKLIRIVGEPPEALYVLSEEAARQLGAWREPSPPDAPAP